LWQDIPLVYPLQWTALYPLIGVALAKDQLAEAVAHARALLAPWQQRMPDALAALIEAAVEAWDKGEPELAREQIKRVVETARDSGYL
jgi:hypothetical protein